LAAIPFGFLWEARTTAARCLIPIDAYVPKGDIDRFPPTIICAAVQSALFYHHKMHMIAGAVTVVAWKATGSSLYEIVPGFIACTIAVVVVSLLDKVPAGVVKNFEEADKTYQAAK